MKIAFLTPEYPHPETGNSGGIGTSIKNLAKGIVDNNQSVIVLVYGQSKDEVFDDNGVIVYKIKNIKLKGLSLFLTQKKIEKLINKLHNDKKIDVVESPDWTGITSFIQPKKCPLVIRLQGSDTYFCHLDNRPVKTKNRFHEKRALQKADGFISVSKYTADLTNDLFNLDKPFTIIPNGIDSSLFYSEDSNKTESVILYFGTLIRKKGLLELPIIFNHVIEQKPNAKLVFIGKDASDVISKKASTWEMMRELFSEKALKNVSYLGSIPYNQMKEQINKSSVCVFPSFAEALPVSWIEAMAMGKPVIASNIGWANELIVDGESGFLVYPKKHDEYASKILTVLNNDSIALQMGKNARRRVEDIFDINIVAKKNIEFYKKVIQNKAK